MQKQHFLYLVTVFFIVFSSTKTGQTQNIQKQDSLLMELKKHTAEDSVRVNLLIDTQPYFIEAEHEKGKIYIEEAINIAEKIGYKPGIAFSRNALAAYYIQRGESEKALENTLIAIEMFEQINEQQHVYAAYNNLAIIYKGMERYKEGIAVYLKMLKELEGRKKTPSFVSVYFNLASIYIEDNDLMNGKKWVQNTISLSEKLNFPQGIASGKNEMASIYLLNKEYKKALKLANEAINYIELQEDESLLKTKALSYLMLGSAFLGLGKYKRANENFFLSLKILTKVNSAYRIGNVQKLISEAYEKQGDYKNALLYKTKHHIIKDSLLSADKTKIIEELQTKYHTEKIKREKEKTELENLRLEKKMKWSKKRHARIYSFLLPLQFY